MRILMLSWEFPPYVVGGLGRHVAELTPALAQRGIEVHVVTPTAKDDEVGVSIEDGITVHRVFAPQVAATMPDIYQRAVETNKIMADYAEQAQIAFGKFDLIHTHDWLTGFAGGTLQAAWGIPLVVTIHATERGRVRGYLAGHLQWAIDGAEHKLIEEARQVIVCSRYMYHELQNLFHTPADKLAVIPNAVMLPDVRNGLNPQELTALRAKFADPGDKIVFTISRLVYEKGVHQLVQAAPRVLNECPEARIVIAGRGPEADYLKQQAIDLNVADRVNFVGFISDEERNHLFRTAACAVFPSLYEPFGIVALEAMALMCPIIVSDVGGFSEMVKHMETGITAYPDDASSIAWGVLHTLNHPDLAREYALKARQSVETLFNWPRVAGLTIDVYQRVLQKQVARSIDR
ncbi:MAG: glycosyltransferase family 4 protein [Anaerolineae bacterium]|nr:glycosyltransferase family 4 protein [Anaerolineales bacterium]MCQ3971985.1 glycosyltransferase family 1 protein [Anaerolineae bacterium]